MKFVLFGFALLLLVVSVQADTLFTDHQIEQNYMACMKFLSVSPAKQAEVAKKAGYPLSQVEWGCRLDKREGLKKMLLLNREYNDWARHKNDGGGSSDSSGPSARTCVSTNMCIGDEQCIGIGGSGTCQSIPGGCANGPNSCIAGETCSNGICH